MWFEHSNPLAPGEDVFRNQLQSHQLSFTLLCAWQLNYIMNTAHRVKQLSIHARYSDRFYWKMLILSKIQSCKEIWSNAFIWSYVQPIIHPHCWR